MRTAYLAARGVACGVLVYLGALGHSLFSHSLYVRLAQFSDEGVDRWAAKDECAGYTKKNFIGVCLVTFAWPLAWVMGVSFSVGVSKHPHVPPVAKTLLFAALAALCTAAAVRSFREAEDVLRWWDRRQSKPAYRVTVGVMTLFASCCGVLLQLRLLFVTRATKDHELGTPLLGGHVGVDNVVADPPPQTRRWKVVAWTLSLLLALAGLLTLTALLPQTWEDMTADGIADWQRTEGGAEEGRLRTIYVRVNHGVVLKFFPDQVIYYSFLASLAVAACVGRLVKVKIAPFVAVSFVAMIALEVRYWLVDHTFDATRSETDAEKYARTFGQLANVTLGLLLLPVSKHSALTAAFGVAWEQILDCHIALGYATLALFACHAICWWIVYDQQHLFPNDVLEVPTYFPTNGQGRAGGRCSDNWTIPLAFITTVLTFLCMSFTFVRRRHFELFYYAHHCFLAIYAVALWHAASAWYYMLGGLAHYMFDHALRTHNATIMWCAHATPGPDDTTHLELVPDSSLGRVFDYAPGQYAFLCFHDLGPLQWHPFTLSAAPTDAKRVNRLSFDVKALGDWTRALRAAALDKRPLTVAVDGPHGAPAPLADAILLICGGIGITPCHALFRDLRNRAFAGSVTLVWVARDAAIFDVFAASLVGLPPNFKVHLCVTAADRGLCAQRDDLEEQPSRLLAYSHGRPDVPSLVSAFNHGAENATKQVFACGPTPLTDAVRKAALALGLPLHVEVFEF